MESEATKIQNSIDGAVINNHPSYGSITVSRSSSSEAATLYGSSVKHRNTIRLTVHHSEQHRLLSGDWYSPTDRIVEVEMSQNQWAELVSSIGLGAGVPCTIRWLNGRVETPPSCSKIEQFKEEFQEKMERAIADADAAIEKAECLLDKKSFTKADKTELLNLMRTIQQSVKRNAPFVYDQFTKQMEKTSTEVKGELEAWQLNQMAAFAALGKTLMEGEQPPALPPTELE